MQAAPVKDLYFLIPRGKTITTLRDSWASFQCKHPKHENLDDKHVNFSNKFMTNPLTLSDLVGL